MTIIWGRCGLCYCLALVGMFACTGTEPSGRLSIDALVTDMGQLDVAVVSEDAAQQPDAALVQSVFFVSADASPGGDGRRQRPFSSVESAYQATRAGDIVFLLPGTYVDFTAPPTGITVQGSGVDVTTLIGPVILDAEAVELAELTVQGGTTGITVTGAAQLNTVAITQVDTALIVQGHVVAQDLNVSSVGSGAEAQHAFDGPNPSEGEAVLIVEDGQFLWERGSLRDCAWVGIRNFGTTDLEQISLSDLDGPGVVNGGGRLVARGLAVTEATAGAILILGGDVEILEGRLADTQMTPLVPLRTGIAAYGGAASIAEVTIEGVNRGLRLSRLAAIVVDGLTVIDPTIDGVSLDSARIEGSGVRVSGAGNTGMSAVGDSQVRLRDVELSDVGRIGLLVSNSLVEIDGLQVSGSDGRGVSLSNATGRLSGVEIAQAENVGVQISDAAGELTIGQGTITGSGTSGVAITGREHEITLSNLTVSNTFIGEAGLGEGVHVFRGRAQLLDLVSQHNAGAGLLVEESSVRSVGLEVRDNAGPGSVFVGSGPETSLDHFVSTANAGAGALVLQGSATFRNFTVRATQRNLAIGPGDGIVASISASVTLADGSSDENAGSGYSIQAGCTATLDTVTARGNGGWGLQTACGQSMVEVLGDSMFTDNRSGDRAVCPE